MCRGPPFCKIPSPCLLGREHGGSSGGWPEHGKAPCPVHSAAPDVPMSGPARPDLPEWAGKERQWSQPMPRPVVGKGRRAPSYPGSASQAVSTQSFQGGCNLSSAGLGEPRARMARDLPTGTSPEGPLPQAQASRPLRRALSSFPGPGSRTGPTKADPDLIVYQSPQDSPRERRRFTKEETRSTGEGTGHGTRLATGQRAGPTQLTAESRVLPTDPPCTGWAKHPPRRAGWPSQAPKPRAAHPNLPAPKGLPLPVPDPGWSHGLASPQPPGQGRGAL